MTTIKITQLTDIGANLATSTVLPVVNMAGTPTTQKTTVGNIANLALSQAGNSYPAAAQAVLAQTVTNAAQPNITSTGTLTNLTVSGNVAVNGNVTANGTAYVGNLSTTGLASVTTLTVGATANLGAVGNVTITGGTVGQVLTTNGSNVLSWTTVTSGNSSYGNSDVANYLPTFTGNIGANVVTANLFVGSGANLTNLAGANVSGTVGLATYATTANAVAGANVSGFVPNANVANTAFAVAGANVSGTVGNANLSQYLNVSDVNNNFSYHIVLSAGSGDKSLHIDADDNLQYNPVDGTLTAVRVDATYVLADLQFSNGYPAANVTGLGNIATINLTGSNSNVLYGNGVFAAVAGGANTGNVTFSDNIVIGTGDEFGDGGLYLAPSPGSVANSAVQYLRVRGGDAPTHIHLDTGNNQYYDQYFGDDAKYVKLELGDAGNVVVGTDDATGNSYRWTFTSDGNLILANGNSVIQSIANSSLDPVNPNVSTMVLTPDPGYSTQSLVLDPTAPGHIHLRAPGANIDEPSANIFLGGEDSSFEVGYYNGAAPNVFIHSNTNTWTFENTGNLNFPAGGNLNFNIGGITQVINQDLEIVVQDEEDDGWSLLNTITDSLGNNLSRTTLDSGSFTITTDITGTNHSWGFEGNTLQVSNDSQIRSFGSNVVLQSMSSGSGGTASLQSVSNTNDPNIFTTFDATTTGANISVYDGGSNSGIGYTWQFANDGRLTFPGTPRIDTATNNFEVQAAEAINFEANTVVNIYTDTGNTTYQWQFGDDGVLTVPGNLAYIGASPAPSISGFNSANFAGNVVGANFIGTLANGNSNVSIATANGNVTISAVGNTTMTITGTGANVTGTLTSTGKIGYASGSTVTQTTNRGNGVTINALAGTIITTSVAMVANEIDTFSVINSSVDPNNDIVLAQIVSPNQGTYNCIAGPALIGGFSNGFYINIVNISGFTTSDETITIRFMVIKAPNA